MSAKDSANEDNAATLIALKSMGELGVVLRALRRFSRSTTYPALAEELAHALGEFNLHGIALVRPRNEAEFSWRTQGGEATALELSMFRQLDGMGRIVEFRTRLAVFYDKAAILVSNFPCLDVELAGRLRDHLTALAEAAEERVDALARERAISKAMSQMAHTLVTLGESRTTTRRSIALEIQDLSDRLELEYVSQALSAKQEATMSGHVCAAKSRILDLIQSDQTAEREVAAILSDLQEVATHHFTTPGVPCSGAGDGGVELFC